MTENSTRIRPYAVARLNSLTSHCVHGKTCDDAAEAYAAQRLPIDIEDGVCLMTVSVHALEGKEERLGFEIRSTPHDGVHAVLIGKTDQQNRLIEGEGGNE